MAALNPVVRHFVLCEDVLTDSNRPNWVSLAGLINAIRSLEQPPFPLRYRELCAYLQLTGCRGPGEGWIEVQHADSGQIAFRTPRRTIPLGTDPLAIVGASFRVQNCLFPEAGLYWVQFWYNGDMLVQQPLLLKG